ncbi:GNAT family N-acetyltransferase [Roseobacter litoralis]|uniref:Acetyltransferase-like protein n=1 Tax=Roseobacter litoralis (strain ATCC 49566 / DSM 6996 / JCM 21268 / NBRC 15278 / OCh 149) TaxID=391595 RepID=F7ZG40_ROSLO|nr:GNAT family N-acetyltransferase [Roseobacter litoralis]AEI94771.1 acetyltransferase-like protein [Roseobacter litoralis Och 149]
MLAVAQSPSSHDAHHISVVSDLSEPGLRVALDDLLLEYYGVIVQKLGEAGMVHSYTPETLMASFWPKVHDLMPPNGRLIVAQDAKGRLVGCGTLHRVRPNAAEVKRLYVRPEAVGHGLGSAIVRQWIDSARAMGLDTLLVNVINSNRDPMGIFERFGFETTERYPECADPIEADPYFIYLRYHL